MIIGPNGKKKKFKSAVMNMSERIDEPGAHHTIHFGDGVSLTLTIKIIPTDEKLHKQLIEKQQQFEERGLVSFSENDFIAGDRHMSEKKIKALDAQLLDL